MTFSFDEVSVTSEIEGLPPSPYRQVILIGATEYDVYTDKLDALGPYTEASNGVELRLGYGYSRYHEELYAECEKDPNEPIVINIGGHQFSLAIRGEDEPHPNPPSAELLFTSTAEDMEANRDDILELAQQVASGFGEQFGWDQLQVGLNLNIYYRESEADAWDTLEPEPGPKSWRVAAD